MFYNRKYLPHHRFRLAVHIQFLNFLGYFVLKYCVKYALETILNENQSKDVQCRPLTNLVRSGKVHGALFNLKFDCVHAI